MKYFILLALFCIGANSQPPPDCNSVFLILIGDNLNDFVNVSLTSNLSPIRGTPGPFGIGVSSYTKYYNPDKKTVVYTNGWRLSYNTDDSKAILGNYVQKRRSEYNIMYIDWSGYTRNYIYITSIGAIPDTSITAFNIMERLRNDNLINFRPLNCHFIGYDLGAHYLHHLAMKIRDENNFPGTPTGLAQRVDRLTGLDPAGLFQFGPFLFQFFGVTQIQRSTAVLTDVIRTSTKKFGLDLDNLIWQAGDIGFWVNGGETQPGCTAKKSMEDFLANQDLDQLDKLACSHSRAWKYYAESILSDNPQIFWSLECVGENYPFSETNCLGNNIAFNSNCSMGYYADTCRFPLAPINFWLATNQEAPYSKS